MEGLLAAIVANDLEGVKCHLEGVGADVKLPRCPLTGDTPFLLAMRLGHKRIAACLAHHPATSFFRTDINHFPNEMYACAYLADDPSFGLAMLARISQSWAVKQGNPFDALKALPCMHATLTLNFTSWVPLMSRFLPRDQVTLIKTPHYLKIDFHIDLFDESSVMFSYAPQSIVVDFTAHKVWWFNHTKRVFEDLNSTPTSGTPTTNFVSAAVKDAHLSWERPHVEFDAFKTPLFPMFSVVPSALKKWAPTIGYAKNIHVHTATVPPVIERPLPEDLVHRYENTDFLDDGLPVQVSEKACRCSNATFGKPYLDIIHTKSETYTLDAKVYMGDPAVSPLRWEVLFGFLSVIGANEPLRKLQYLAMTHFGAGVPVGVELSGFLPTLKLALYLDDIRFVAPCSDDAPWTMPEGYTLEKSKPR